MYLLISSLSLRLLITLSYLERVFCWCAQVVLQTLRQAANLINVKHFLIVKETAL